MSGLPIWLVGIQALLKPVDVRLIPNGRVDANIKSDSSSATRLSRSIPATWDRMPKVPRPLRRECGFGS